MNEIKIKRKTLENGIRLIIIDGLVSTSATIAAYVKSGFRYDPIELPGLAHFTEHMLFNGTKSYPNPSTVARAVEQYGGWHDAFTWIEHQKHIVHMPKDRFAEGAKLLLETISAPIIKTEEIEKEKGMVSEEILRNKSDPSKAIWDYALMPLFFQGTHLARPYSGTLDDIKRIKKRDVENFIDTYFIPQNIVILVAGGIEPLLVEETIFDQTKDLEQKNRKIEEKKLNLKLERRIMAYNDPSYYQTSIVVGVKTASYDSEDKEKLVFLQQMVGGGFSSTLIQKLRDENGLIYTWNSSSDFIKEGGYSFFTTSCAHEHAEKVANTILNEYRRIGRGEFSKQEFEKAKGFASGLILANIETGRDYIEWYGEQELLYPSKALGVEDKAKIYNNYSFDEIRETASRYFIDENIFLGVVGNVNKSNIEDLLRS